MSEPVYADPDRQRAFDRAMLLAIAAHVRDNPPPGYSGRQCDELLQFVAEEYDEPLGWRIRFNYMTPDRMTRANLGGAYCVCIEDAQQAALRTFNGYVQSRIALPGSFDFVKERVTRSNVNS